MGSKRRQKGVKKAALWGRFFELDPAPKIVNPFLQNHFQTRTPTQNFFSLPPPQARPLFRPFLSTPARLTAILL